jgi:hypothetical protein
MLWEGAALSELNTVTPHALPTVPIVSAFSMGFRNRRIAGVTGSAASKSEDDSGLGDRARERVDRANESAESKARNRARKLEGCVRKFADAEVQYVRVRVCARRLYHTLSQTLTPPPSFSPPSPLPLSSLSHALALSSSSLFQTKFPRHRRISHKRAPSRICHKRAPSLCYGRK